MSLPSFDFRTAARIRFGRGVAAEAPEAIAAFGRRVLVVHGRSAARADWLVDGLQSQGMTLQSLSCPGEPDLAQLEAGLAQARAGAPDVVVGLGGGAALDLAKALAALIPATGDPLDHLEVVGKGLPLTQPPLPFVAIPTTAGTGAEVTKNAVIGVPAHRRKVSLRDDRMLARLALVDPGLTDDAPAEITMACGLDAVTQVIEPYLSTRANPMTDALCRDAIPRGLRALARLASDPSDRAARDDMAYVSVTGGLALANAGLGAVHGLAGVIGGRAPVAHGAVCGALLPHVLQANRAALAPDRPVAARMEEVFGWVAQETGTEVSGFAGWCIARGLPRFASFGLDPAVFPEIAAAAQASSSMKPNPVPLEAGALTRILEAAQSAA